MPSPVVLDDLAEPQFSPEVQEIRAVMDAMAEDCPLDVLAMHKQASEELNLDDFGATDYMERLEVLVRAMREVPGLNGPGRVNFRSQLVQMLRNRLLITDLLRRHPEIVEINLLPPVVIAGLPRSGTTHLHNMLAAAPTFRTLPYWESLEPVPRPTEIGQDPDPRRERSDQALWFTNLAMPHFPLMHEMTTDHVHEDIQLITNDFSSMYFETLAELPAWREYYLAHDQTPHYAYMALQLKAMQFLRGGRRWLLKAPQHLEQLPVLNSVFPGLTTIVTHRDPVAVVVSAITMMTYAARMHRAPVPARELGEVWATRFQGMLEKLVRDRDVLDPEHSLDVPFDEFMADDFGTAKEVYTLAGEEWDRAVEVGVRSYLETHPKGRLGTVDYRAADIGLDPDDLRERFRPYIERFLA